MLTLQESFFYTPKGRQKEAEVARKGLSQPQSDHLTLLMVWNKWVDSGYSSSWAQENYIQNKSLRRARDVRAQLERLVENAGMEMSSSEDEGAILKSLLSGFFLHVAVRGREGNIYRTIRNNVTVYIHPSSALFGEKPDYVLYHELLLTSKEYMRCISELQTEWLHQVAPEFFSKYIVANKPH